MKNILNLIFIKSPVLKMVISFILFIIGLVITDNTNTTIFFYIGLVFLGYGLIIFIIGIIYAYILNPIKENK